MNKPGPWRDHRFFSASQQLENLRRMQVSCLLDRDDTYVLRDMAWENSLSLKQPYMYMARQLLKIYTVKAVAERLTQ